MSRPRTSKGTTERGYGTHHQRTRAQLLPRAIGTRCPMGLPGCDGIMVDPKRMDLDHSIPLALGGSRGDRLVCRHCNRSAGATLGNRLRARRPAVTMGRTPIRSRRW